MLPFWHKLDSWVFRTLGWQHMSCMETFCCSSVYLRLSTQPPLYWRGQKVQHTENYDDYLCMRLSVQLFLSCRLSIGAFPLTLNMHKLKLIIENLLNGNMSHWKIKKKKLIQCSNYARMRWHFREKRYIWRKCKGNTFTDRMMHGKSICYKRFF